MVWDYIRDFFVLHIFGGTLSDNTLVSVSGGSITFDIGNNQSMLMGDWLSTTATIITLALLVAFLFLCVRYLFKVVAGLITLRG